MCRITVLAAITLFLVSISAAGFASAPLGSLPDDANYPMYTIPAWTDSQGWDTEAQYTTIQACDINGDGNKEIIARLKDGLVSYSFNNQTGMWDYMVAETPLHHFDDVTGWDHPSNYRTILCADVNGDGAEEMIGRYPMNGGGVYIDRLIDPETVHWRAGIMFDYWTDAGGWEQPQYYETIQSGDIDGDGTQEIIARGSQGLYALFYTPAKRGFNITKSEILTEFSDANGWGKAPFYHNIHVDDIDGDGKDEIWALGPDSVQLWGYNASNPGSKWGIIVHRGTSPGDWTKDDPAYYSTWQAADFDGDGIKEIFGRTTQGINFIVYHKGGYFDYTTEYGILPGFADGTDYDKSAYYHSIRAADTDGDGKDELWVLSSSGLTGYKLTKTFGGFKLGQSLRGPSLKPDRLWDDDDKHYWETFSFADVNGDGSLEILIRGGSGMRTYQYDGTEGKWKSPEASFTAYASEEQAVAYNAVLESLRAQGLLGPSADLRAAYKDMGKGTWANMALAISNTERPAVSQKTWDAVTGQLILELNAVSQVTAIYNKNREFYNNLITLYSNQLDACVTMAGISGTSWANKNVPVLIGEFTEFTVNLAIDWISLTLGQETKMIYSIGKPFLKLALSAIFTGIFEGESVGSDTSTNLKYSELKTKLNLWFLNNLARNTHQYEDVVSGWSKLSHVNEFYNTFGEGYLSELDNTLEPLTALYKRFSYQSLMPLKYDILYKLNWSPGFGKGAHWYTSFSYTEPPQCSWTSELFKDHWLAADKMDYFFIVAKGNRQVAQHGPLALQGTDDRCTGRRRHRTARREEFFKNTESWKFKRTNRSKDVVI